MISALHVITLGLALNRLCEARKCSKVVVFIGGSSGIRTLEPLRVAGFQDRCNRPLCQASDAPILVQCCTAIWNIKTRLLCHGGVANPRDTCGYRRGLRLALTQNPSFLFVPSSMQHYASGCHCLLVLAQLELGGNWLTRMAREVGLPSTTSARVLERSSSYSAMRGPVSGWGMRG